MRVRHFALVAGFALLVPAGFMATQSFASAPAAPAASNALLAHKTVKAIDDSSAQFGFSFAPKKITVKVGTKVTWKNTSAAEHTVTSNKHGLFNKTLSMGGTVSYTFKKTGVYKYHCTFHPGMAGEVIVKG